MTQQSEADAMAENFAKDCRRIVQEIAPIVEGLPVSLILAAAGTMIAAAVYHMPPADREEYIWSTVTMAKDLLISHDVADIHPGTQTRQ